MKLLNERENLGQQMSWSHLSALLGCRVPPMCIVTYRVYFCSTGGTGSNEDPKSSQRKES